MTKVFKVAVALISLLILTSCGSSVSEKLILGIETGGISISISGLISNKVSGSSIVVIGITFGVSRTVLTASVIE